LVAVQQLPVTHLLSRRKNADHPSIIPSIFVDLNLAGAKLQTEVFACSSFFGPDRVGQNAKRQAKQTLGLSSIVRAAARNLSG
jgi:hypothetical protein